MRGIFKSLNDVINRRDGERIKKVEIEIAFYLNFVALQTPGVNRSFLTGKKD